MYILFKEPIAYYPSQNTCQTTGNLTCSVGKVKRNELSLSADVRHASLLYNEVFSLSYYIDPQGVTC